MRPSKYGFAHLFILIAGLIIAGSSELQGQNVSKKGTVAAEFLQVGVGERAMGLGGAYVAMADDITALYWNPAGITHIKKYGFTVSKTNWIADLELDHFGMVYRIRPNAVVGFSLQWLGYPSLLVRTETFPDGTGETFGGYDMAAGLTYGLQVTNRFRVGATLKLIRQNIWHTSAQTAAMDIGTQFETDLPGKLVIGAVIRNFGGQMKMEGRDLRAFIDPDPISLGNNDRVPMNLETEPWPLPMVFQFGVAAWLLDTRMHKLLMEVDALHPNANHESMNIGLEYSFQDRFDVRTGYNALFLPDAESGFTVGVGVRKTMFNGHELRIEYGYKPIGRLGQTHSFGITIGR